MTKTTERPVTELPKLAGVILVGSVQYTLGGTEDSLLVVGAGGEGGLEHRLGLQAGRGRSGSALIEGRA